MDVCAIIFAILWIHICPAHSLIPSPCKYNLTSRVPVCCPPPAVGSPPCGGPGRGVCAEFQVHREYGENFYNRYQKEDDRIRWPTKLFKYGCHCDKNYWGFACHECWYGWTGEDCQTRQISIRRNILSYTAEEKRLYQQVMLKSHHARSEEYVIFRERDGRDSDPLTSPHFLDVSVHQMLIFVHRYTSRSTMYNTVEQCTKNAHFDFNHGGVGFVTWHRFFMMFWERQVAKLAKRYFGVKDFRFPYWDWTDAKSCTVCTPDMVGDLANPSDPSNTSPFRHWVEYCGSSRRVACNACHTRMLFNTPWGPLKRGWDPSFHFPSKSQVDFTLSRKYYYVQAGGHHCQSFAHTIEGDCGSPNETTKFFMHNGVHNGVNGPFSTAAGSTNDPLFPMHHLQIDRVFSAWFRLHQPHPKTMPNRGMKNGHCRDCNLIGMIPTLPHFMMLVDTRALGYDYDSLEFGKSAGEGRTADGHEHWTNGEYSLE